MHDTTGEEQSSLHATCKTTIKRLKNDKNGLLPSYFATNNSTIMPPIIEISQCCVCFETNRKGIKCNNISNSHFICRDCFSPYIQSLCEESFKLLDSCGQITCPVQSCCSKPWSSHDVRQIVTGDVLEKYIDILVLSIKRMSQNQSITGSDSIDSCKNRQHVQVSREDYESIKINDVHKIIDAMTLKCPNKSCSIALDPTPDGCCAMRCYSCGCHFCWLCFNIQATSSLCHNHVRKCPENLNPDTLFATNSEIADVHRHRSIEAIRRALISIVSEEYEERNETMQYSDDNGINDLHNFCSNNNINNNRSDNYGSKAKILLQTDWINSQRCVEAVHAAKPLLADSNISPDDIFASTDIEAVACNDSIDGSSSSLSFTRAWDVRNEIKSSLWLLLTVLEAIMGLRMVSSFICSLFGIASWYFCSAVMTILASLALWRPAEVTFTYFILGFFQFIKYIVYLRGFILANSFWMQTTVNLAIGIYLYFSSTNASESNIVISFLHLLGVFLVDLTLYMFV